MKVQLILNYYLVVFAVFCVIIWFIVVYGTMLQTGALANSEKQSDSCLI